MEVWQKRLARTGDLDRLSEPQVQRLSVLAALHDLGKFNIGFQNKISPQAKVKAGHVSEALQLFVDQNLKPRVLQILDFDTLQKWTDGPQKLWQLLLASFSHHGKPVQRPEMTNPKLWEKDQLEPFDGMRKLVEQARNWFPDAFEADFSDRLPSHPGFQHAFCGLVMLADWIASDRRMFPFSSSLTEDRISFAREQAQEALVEFGIDTRKQRSQIQHHFPSFSEMFNHDSPRALQQAIEDIQLPKSSSLMIIESETGCGKTEAAVRYFLRLFKAGMVDGMVFALPTRSAASQLHRRIHQAVEAAFLELALPVVLAVPGYLRVDDVEGKKLPNFEVLWHDDEKERYRYRGWAAEHPKRYMAAPILVGTVDQVLLSALQVSHAHLRASCLLRHLLVVDEVHASDTYMTRILEEVLKFHLQSGGHALLMSATLGSSARERFLELGSGAQPPPFEQAKQTPFPLIMVKEANRRKELPVESDSPERDFFLECKPLSGDAKAVASLALSFAHQGAKVVVLRNLVEDAIKTQLLLEELAGKEANLLFRCENLPAPHHGRFSREDRLKLDKELEKFFGKKSKEGGALVVATQTVEQSLDVDFDVMLTDLCPIDVLLQRLGRVHRHPQRKRPNGFEKPKAFILTPQDRNLGKFVLSGGSEAGLARGPHGIGTVYEDLRILEATWRLLEKEPRFLLPKMNRYLVEAGTHPNRLAAIVEELGDCWREHERRMLGLQIAHRQQGGLNCINRGVDFGSVDAAFAGLDEKIRTRLGEEDRLVHFDPEVRSPFGTQLKKLAIPASLAKMCDREATKAESLQLEDHRVIFTYGGVGFAYDRLGLRRRDAQSSD